MFEKKEKKPYEAPDLEGIPMDDDDMDDIVGGIKDAGKSKKKKKVAPVTPPAPPSPTDPPAVVDKTNPGADAGNGDVGRGRGRGGGCDGVPYHRMARTFSSGRNSGC